MPAISSAEVASGTTHGFESVWGSSGSDVFAVGGIGTILHYDGKAWSDMSSGAAPVAAAPTATRKPKPPTATPTPTPVFTLATSAEEVAGTWVAGNYYIRFDKDGTYRQAHALDKLDSRPYAISAYRFEGTTLVSTEIKVSGVRSCGKKSASYEIRLLESGNIWIVAIQDDCTGRKGDTEGEYEPVR